MKQSDSLAFLITVCFALLLTTNALAAEPAAAPDPETLQPAGSTQFTPPNDGYDWLQLTSGEWLKGEMIGLFNDEVEFDSEILDRLVIDGEDIKGFFSSRNFGVTLRGQEMVNGQIRVNDGQVLITSQGKQNVYEREQLIAITASAERERDRWSGDLALGINLREGNTERIEYNMVAGINRSTPQSRLFIDYIGSYNKTDNVETANDHRINLAYDRFSDSRLFWRPVLGQYLRDPFQNIKHQGTLETGLGYELIDNSRTEWHVFAGAGFNYVRRISVEAGQPGSSTSPAFSLGTHFDTELTSWMDYLFDFQVTFLDEESGEYQHHLITSLSTDLIGDLDLDISFVWDRTRNPPPTADGLIPEKDDFRLMTGIGFEF